MAEAEEKIETPELEPDKVIEEEPEATDPEEPENEDPEEGDDPEGDDPEPEPETAKPVAVDAQQQALLDEFNLKPVDGETPRELALRVALAKERRKNRGTQIDEIVKPETPAPKKPSAASEILNKYKPEEIASLREVLPALAEEMGFVRKDELQATSYEEQANKEINDFIESHPEYLPDNDPEGVLWDQLRTEYQQFYKKPADPKNYRKIFERIHKDIMGIQTTGPLPKVKAAAEKVKVASHGGPSASRVAKSNGMRPATGGLRTDGLIGFTEEEIANIEARAQ